MKPTTEQRDQTTGERMNDLPEGTILIEVRGLYDGWSIAKLPDGTYRNRWDVGDRRHGPTQHVIDGYVSTELAMRAIFEKENEA